MASDTFVLAGTQGGSGNGYWSPAGGAVLTPTGMNAVNFVFEKLAGGNVRLTIFGTYSVAAASAGYAKLNCILPLTVLPAWAWPRLSAVGSVFNQSVALGGSFVTPNFLNLAPAVAQDGNNMLLTFGGYTLSASSTSNACSSTIEYLGQF